MFCAAPFVTISVFSFGLLMLEMVTGNAPARSMDEATHGVVPQPSSEVTTKYKQLVDTAMECCQIEPQKRPKPTNLLKMLQE